MKRAGLFTFLVRETRGALGRASFLVVCVAIGVAAVVTVASLSSAVRAELRSNSRQLLAADLSIESRQPLPDDLGAAIDAAAPDAERTHVREMASMVALATGDEGTAPRSRLAELKVIEGRFPLHGELILEPAGTLTELLTAETVVCAPDLLDTLGARIGDTLDIGGAGFRIAAEVLEEPDRMEFGLVLGPRVFMSQAGLERTSLLGVGNRVKYRMLLRVTGNPERGALEDLEDEIEAGVANAERLRTINHFQAQPGVRRGLERFTSYLGLVALLSLALGGIDLRKAELGSGENTGALDTFDQHVHHLVDGRGTGDLVRTGGERVVRGDRHLLGEPRDAALIRSSQDVKECGNCNRRDDGEHCNRCEKLDKAESSSVGDAAAVRGLQKVHGSLDL